MTDLWIATGNPKKRVELDRLLAPLGVTLRLQSEAPEPITVEEDQPDFAGNARKKAVALATVVRAPTVADDSGLCVDALDGRPGVRSARYAATDPERVSKLLAELADTAEAQRTARFVSSIALVSPSGDPLAHFEATCEGRIAFAPRGTGGFGYDPVFVPRELADVGTTFAELSATQKDSLSHRGKALRALAAWLAENPLIP